MTRLSPADQTRFPNRDISDYDDLGDVEAANRKTNVKPFNIQHETLWMFYSRITLNVILHKPNMRHLTGLFLLSSEQILQINGNSVVWLTGWSSAHPSIFIYDHQVEFYLIVLTRHMRWEFAFKIN